MYVTITSSIGEEFANQPYFSNKIIRVKTITHCLKFYQLDENYEKRFNPGKKK